MFVYIWLIELIFIPDEEETIDKDEEVKKRLQIFETFRDAPFEEIVARSEAKVSNHESNYL